MTHFMGTHQNRLDAKGRVSIPAAFRATLRGDNPAAGAIPLVLRPSHFHPCIEGWPVAAFHAMATPLDTMDVFSSAHDDFAATLFSDAYPMEADREGRIVLPDQLVAHAGLSETVVFMGLGRNFQIWEPHAAEQRRLEARQRSRERGLTAASPQPQNLSGVAPQQTLGTPGQ